MAIDMAMENLPLRDSFPRGLDLHLVLASSHIWLLESCCNTTTTKPVFFPRLFYLSGKGPTNVWWDEHFRLPAILVHRWVLAHTYLTVNAKTEVNDLPRYSTYICIYICMLH